MSVSHILVGNDNPLNVEFNNITIDGSIIAGPSSSISVPPKIINVVSSVSGPWASYQVSNYHISYIGTPGPGGTALQVTVNFDPVDAIASVATYITITPNLPVNFRNTNGQSVGVSCFENGQYITGYCIGSIDNQGNIFVEAPGANNFAGTGTTGFDNWSITYSLPPM